MEKKWLILIVVLIVVIFLGYWFYMRKAKYTPTPTEEDAVKTVKWLNNSIQNPNSSNIFGNDEVQNDDMKFCQSI